MGRNMWTSLCQVLLFGCMINYGFAVDQPPRFINDMDGLQLSEDTRPGTIVYVLSGTDPEGRSVKYAISTSIFEVDEYTGEVTLKRRLDYENNKVIHVEVTISDGPNTVPRNIIVSLRDVNDVIPSFSKPTYFEKIPENTAINQIIVSNIQVADADGVNSLITVTCNPGVAHQEDCRTFKVVQTGVTSTNSWQGQLILAETLNYETKKSYQVPLVAYDGKNNKTQSIEIQVVDVADSPPYFVAAFSKNIKEVDTIGTVIAEISARDGDKFTPREIRYEIDNAPLDYFSIDSVTGIITNKVPLDREDPRIQFEHINVPLKVREVISDNPLVLGDTPSTTATITIRVTLLDINDNKPVFSSNYTSRVPEDVLDNGVVHQLLMTVTDKDTREFANYSFQVDRFGDVFVVYPEYGEGVSIVGLKVKNTSLIDYEKGPRVYNFQVIAREVNTKERYSGSTYITIYVDDANDNGPRVAQSPLMGTVPENAATGFEIIDINAVDDDSGDFGTIGIRYISLKGIGQQLFLLNSITGIITVNTCATPGTKPCLDYEVKRQYNLTVVIVDNKDDRSNVQKRQMDLIINVQDANDNGPIFSTAVYFRKILEGTTSLNDDILFNQVTDPDTVGRLQFSIVQQEVNGLFVIDRDTGTLTAIRPVTLSDSGSDTYNDIEVSVSDGIKTDSATVKIEIIDENNHRPVFSQKSYRKCISEQFPGGTSVLQVQATDLDRPGTANSEITYSIVFGADGLFFLEPNGVLKSTFRARFDYETKKTYNLQIMAKDSGLPSLNDTALVTICIDDFNDITPYFIPFTVQVNVNESVPVNIEIIQLRAFDSDQTAKLQFSFTEPSNAINPNGLTVTKANYDYSSLFRMDPDNGKIFIAKALNRDQVSLITHTVQVVDTAGVDQTGTGTIIINILDVNKIPPKFTKPWTPSTPFYNVNLNEEQSVGSSVITLNAVDDDGSIEGYELAETKGYFVINKGVVTVNKRIDFEVIEKLSFVAYAWDNVEPKMTATATVFVNIQNINDNNPLFKAPIYSFTIEENSFRDQKVGFVSATDIDKGTYGNVLYSIQDATKSFKINSVTGEITVMNSAALDRETVGEIIVQVTAYDSPFDSSVRRNSTVPVYITLKDQNDHAPIFLKEFYSQTVEEGIAIGTSIFEVSAKDKDIGVNAIVTYRKSNGEPAGLFSVSTSGAIGVSKNLQNKSGIYSFMVTAWSGNMQSDANVTIVVVKGISAAPQWKIPSTDNEVVNVLESQYKGLFIYRVRAESPDTGPKGRIKYMFFVDTVDSQSTNEFYINPITGVISALRIFDREEKDSYTLEVIAQDSNIIPQRSDRSLRIKILDVNDNKPEFSVSNGVVIPYTFQVYENSKPIFYIGSVNAKDRDEYGKVYYRILSGNPDNVFSLNQNTGALYLEKLVDRENISSFSLNIEAMDSLINYDLLTPNHIRRLERKWADLNVAHIDIQIADVNDEKPKFSKSQYYGCISTEDGLLKSILTVKAIDKDISSDSLEYSIANIRRQDGLSIKEEILSVGKKNGIIRNQQSMSLYKDTVFFMDIKANDMAAKNATDTAKGLIFVTETRQAVKLVLAQPSTDVHYFIPQIKKLLSQKSDDSYICVSDIREHILPNGLVNPHWSDVFIYVIRSKDGKYTVDGATSAVAQLNMEKRADEPLFSGIYIQKIKVAETSDDSEDTLPLLLIMILVVFLILLALILFCIACCCIARNKQKKIEKATYAQNLKAPPAKHNDFPITSIYHNKGFNPNEDDSNFRSVTGPLESAMVVDSASQGRRSSGSHDRIFEDEDLGDGGGNISDQHEEMAMAGLGNSELGRNSGLGSRKSLHSRNSSYGQHEDILPDGLDNNSDRPNVFIFDAEPYDARPTSQENLHMRTFGDNHGREIPNIFVFDAEPYDARPTSQENLHMRTFGDNHGREIPNQFVYDTVPQRADTPAPYSERNISRSGQNELPFDSTSYGQGSAHDGGMLTPYPGSNNGSEHRERLLTPYARSVNDVNEQQGEMNSPDSHDNSGKRFAPYSQEYDGHGSRSNLTPDPYNKSFDFNDEAGSSNVSEPDDMPLYSVVNKIRSPPSQSEVASEFPDVVDLRGPSPSDGFPDPEPVIMTSVLDPDEEPKIECILEPDIESDLHQNSNYNPPPPDDDDEPVIVTEPVQAS